MHHAAGNTASEFGLGSLERSGSGILVTGFSCGFDFLHEATDAAHAGAVHFGTGIVATDALTGLRRVGHMSVCLAFCAGRSFATG